MPAVVYRIDREDHLCSFNEQWDRFALANDGAGVVAAKVLGTSLLDHISDPTLRHLTGELIAKVRRDREVVVLPMRCDSPGVQRFMNLSIAPADDGQVEFSVELREQRPVESIALLDVSQSRSAAFVTICSWCKRALVDANWRGLPEAVAALRIFESGSVPRVTHGLCPDCHSSLEHAL